MSASDLSQQLDYPEHPYAELEYIDYLELRRTETRLDTARQEVEKEYENLSKCHVDNMTYAKAQLDHARQKEKDCFKDLSGPTITLLQLYHDSFVLLPVTMNSKMTATH